MANSRQNVDEVGQDFNKAIKTAQTAIQQAMAAVKELGEMLAQVVKKIEESTQQPLVKSLAGIQGGPAKGLDLEPFTKGLDAKATDLSQKNRQLANSLRKLRELHGNLPRDSAQELSQQMKTLDDSIKVTNQRNQQLISSVAKNAVVNSKLPPLTADLQTKAAASLNAALMASPSGLKPNPKQAADLMRLNTKTALFGHKLSESSRKSALEVKDVIETKLNETSSIMKQFRVSLQPKPVSKPEVEDAEKQLTKKKHRR